MVQHTDMGMIVMKEECQSHRSLERGGTAYRSGPHGDRPGGSGCRREEGRRGPEPSLGFFQEGMSERGQVP